MPQLTAFARDPARSPLANGASAEATPFARLKVAQLALKVEAQRLSLDDARSVWPIPRSAAPPAPGPARGA